MLTAPGGSRSRGALDDGSTRPPEGVPHPPPAAWWVRRAAVVDNALLAAALVLVLVLVKLSWPRFTWFGDNAESFFPLWHIVGSGLREGRWLGFDPTGFSGGNTVAEAAYGMFNPVTLLNAVGISLTDELARASFVVMVEFLVLFGLGVRVLARSYGASRSASLVAGLITPLGGFTLFWEAGNWASGLMAVTWVTWSWASARRYAIGAGGPGPLVVALALAITVGNPYSLLGLSVVALAALTDLALRRDWRRIAGFVLVGLVAVTFVALTYGPLLHALPVAERGSMAAVSNSGYLAPSMGDLLGASSPTLLPQINAWSATADKVPSVYLSWVLLPLLPWLRAPHRGQLRRLAGLLVGTGALLAMTLGPDQVWLFRWPLRLIEYSWVGVAVLFAVVLSRGLALDHVVRRSVASTAFISLGAYAAWASQPTEWVRHVAMSCLVGSLLTGLLWAARRFGIPGVAAVTVLGTVLITPAQAGWYAWDGQEVVADLDLGRASDLSTIREQTVSYEGTVLQLANLSVIEDPAAVMSGDLSFGHVLAAAGHPTLNRYSGIGYSEFVAAVSMDYRGSVYSDVTSDLMYVDVPGYDTAVVDALGISTLVVAKPGFKPSDHLPRAGWHVAADDAHRTVLVRDRVLPAGPPVTGSPGVTVQSTSTEDGDVSVDIIAPRGGTVLLGELAWPGYRATDAEGTPLTLSAGPLGLVEIAVPPGTTVVHVSYSVPGLDTSLALCALASLVALGHQVWWTTRTRPRGGRGRDRSATATAGGTPPGGPSRHATDAGRTARDLPTRIIPPPLPPLPQWSPTGAPDARDSEAGARRSRSVVIVP